MGQTKRNFKDFIPIILSVVLIIGGLVYAYVHGISNEDYLNRTSNFFIPFGMFVLGLAILHICFCVESVRIKDYLTLTFEIIQGIIVIASMLYWIYLTDQYIPISEQIREYTLNENWDAALELERAHFDLWSKQRWLPFATYIIVFALNWISALVRRIQKWFHQNDERKNREEDQ
jgi:hypothetical protein